jgi:thiamine-monophosphate kinase
VGAELLATTIPISRAAKEFARGPARESAEAPAPNPSPRRTPLLAALTDGEDFELLFTVAARDAVPLLDTWKKEFPKLPLTCIGKIVAGEGVHLRDKQGVRPLTAHGYEHFK